MTGASARGASDDGLWDLAVVGAGPAGAAAALGALRADPALSVLLLDRAEFPRDKPCGDGVAPHVLDLLAEVGVGDVVADRVPVRRLRLHLGETTAARSMARPAWVVPREVFDQRLVIAARGAGATLVRGRVRSVDPQPHQVVLDSGHRARVVIGADGAHSAVRLALGAPGGPTAIGLRGYAPTVPDRVGEQVIVFGTSRQPSYAWSFDRGDGLANVGYGELLTPTRPRPSRQQLLAQLETLLPGASAGGERWRGHQLPLSSAHWSPPPGRVLLAGDAARLVNPLTGEGIYYAVATGLLAGRAAAGALAAGTGADAGARYRRTSRRLLARHLRHTAVAARLSGHDRVLAWGLRAAAADQRVFDDLVEMGLGHGRFTAALARGLATQAAGRARTVVSTR